LRSWSGFADFRSRCDETSPNAIPLSEAIKTTLNAEFIDPDPNRPIFETE